MKQAVPSRKTTALKVSFVLFLLLALIIAFLYPVIHRARKAADLSSATCHIRSIGTLFVLFDQDYGHFPTTQLPDDPKIRAKFTQRDREDANYIIGHLIRLGYTDSEAIFYAPYRGKTREPDGKIATDEELLAPGECGFTYLSFQDRPMTTKDNGNLPLLVTPLHPCGKADPKPYDGKAVYLRLDSSVQIQAINENGEIILKNEHTLFQTGAGTAWEGGHQPKLHHPLYRGDEVP
ncbi:MAG: hypothetical protein ACQKBY_11350 [Verrucomicrobiales bacterium]